MSTGTLVFSWLLRAVLGQDTQGVLYPDASALQTSASRAYSPGEFGCREDLIALVKFWQATGVRDRALRCIPARARDP